MNIYYYSSGEITIIVDRNKTESVLTDSGTKYIYGMV